MRPFRLLLPLLIVVAHLLASAPVAAANTYFVYSCKTRLGAIAPLDGFTAANTSEAALTYDNCSSGGSLVASLGGANPQPSGARAAWRFTAPPNTEIRQFDVWRWGTTVSSPSDGAQEPAQYTAFPGADFAVDRREWCNANVCNLRGIETSQLDVRNQWWSGTLNNVRDVYFAAGCVGGYTCAARGAGGRPMAQMQIQGVQWMLVDDHFPSATTPVGDLVGAGPHKGTETVSFNGADQGAGLYWTIIEIRKADETEYTVAKRQIVDANGGHCAELEGFAWTPYEFGYAVPCRLAASVEVGWDTKSLPDGKYQLRVRLEDAAGNSTMVSPTRAFEIDNVPPPAAIVPPKINGVARKDGTLMGDRGAWNAPGLTFTDAWLRCSDSADLASCEPISGATADKYTLTAVDLGRYLRYRVTATSSDGTGTVPFRCFRPGDQRGGRRAPVRRRDRQRRRRQDRHRRSGLPLPREQRRGGGHDPSRPVHADAHADPDPTASCRQWRVRPA